MFSRLGNQVFRRPPALGFCFMLSLTPEHLAPCSQPPALCRLRPWQGFQSGSIRHAIDVKVFINAEDARRLLPGRRVQPQQVGDDISRDKLLHPSGVFTPGQVHHFCAAGPRCYEGRIKNCKEGGAARELVGLALRVHQSKERAGVCQRSVRPPRRDAAQRMTFRRSWSASHSSCVIGSVSCAWSAACVGAARTRGRLDIRFDARWSRTT